MKTLLSHHSQHIISPKDSENLEKLWIKTGLILSWRSQHGLRNIHESLSVSTVPSTKVKALSCKEDAACEDDSGEQCTFKMSSQTETWNAASSGWKRGRYFPILEYFSRMMLNRILLQDCRCCTGLPAELSPNIKKTKTKNNPNKHLEQWNKNYDRRVRTADQPESDIRQERDSIPLPEVCQGLWTVVKGRGTEC